MQVARPASFEPLDYHKEDYSSRGRVKRFFGEQIPKLHSGYVLDVGCSLGHTTYDLSEIYPSCKILGIDIDEKSVSKARKSYGEKNITFTAMDGYSNPLPEKSFGAVYTMNNVFFRVVAGRIGALRGLKEIGKLAEPEGHLFICSNSMAQENFGIFKRLMRGNSFEPVIVKCHPKVDWAMGRIIRALQ